MTGPEKHDDAHGITRKKLLKTAAVAGSALVYGGHATSAGARARRAAKDGGTAGMNVLALPDRSAARRSSTSRAAGASATCPA